MKRLLAYLVPLLLSAPCLSQDEALEAPPPAPPPDALKLLAKMSQAHLRLKSAIIDLEVTGQIAPQVPGGGFVKWYRNDATHFRSEWDTQTGPFQVYVNGPKKLIYVPEYAVYADAPPELAMDPLHGLAASVDKALKATKPEDRIDPRNCKVRADDLDGTPVYVVYFKNPPAEAKKTGMLGVNLVMEAESGLLRRLRLVTGKQNLLFQMAYDPRNTPLQPSNFVFTPPPGVRKVDLFKAGKPVKSGR